MNLKALVRDQNRQWFKPNYLFPETGWYRRLDFPGLYSSLSKDLSLSLTGLRRTGKSTLIRQMMGRLLKEGTKPSHIFYFSFDHSVVQNESEVLRSILETYAANILNQPLNETGEDIYLFLDEIQVIPYWQDIVKTYIDFNPRLHFVMSGSSSLFISQKSKESLAGRLKEFTILPLAFKEYLAINVKASQAIEKIGMKKYTSFYPEYLNAFFESYLEDGQFPQIIKNQYTQKEASDYLRSIEDKIVEADLPRTFPIKRPDILKIIYTYFKQYSGSILSYDNLTNDLGIDIRTTVKYVDWLKKAFLLNLCFNHTKKMAKASRTAKKIYLSSTNLAMDLSTGLKVENYIYNWLRKNCRKVEFYRQKNEEIDFIVTNKENQLIPVEVKYREKIEPKDEKSLLKFAQSYQSPCALLITKKPISQTKRLGRVRLDYIPASQIEFSEKTAIFLQDEIRRPASP